MKRLKTLVFTLVVLLFIPIFPLYTKRGYHCEYTGSTKSWIAWPLGFQSDYEYKKSKLEEFIENKFSDELKHKWVSYDGTGFNIFGRAIIFSHGRPNPLFQLSGNFLDHWCASASGPELKQLYELLQRGERKEIQERVEEIQREIEASIDLTN